MRSPPAKDNRVTATALRHQAEAKAHFVNRAARPDTADRWGIVANGPDRGRTALPLPETPVPPDFDPDAVAIPARILMETARRLGAGPRPCPPDGRTQRVTVAADLAANRRNPGFSACTGWHGVTPRYQDRIQ